MDGCAGATYGECFVRLGTGDRKIVGRQWIFYDQIWLKDWIDLDVEPLILPMMSTVSGVHRTLTIDTIRWPENHRRDLRRRFRATLRESKAAYRRGEKDRRPWIFFVGREELYDQTGFQADLQPGVEALVCTMPRQQRAFRPSARFVYATRHFYGQEAATETPPSAKAEFIGAPVEDHAAASAAPMTADNSGQKFGTGSPFHDREDCEPADEQPEAKLRPSTEPSREEAEERLLELPGSDTGINAGSTHARHECKEAKEPERVEGEPTGGDPGDPDHGAQDSEGSAVAASSNGAAVWARMRRTVLRLMHWKR